MHIRASEIQRPRNIVKGSHQHSVSMEFSQRLTDTGNFHACSLTGIDQRMLLHRILRNRRTILPDLRQWVEVGTESDTALFPKFGNQFSDATGGVHHTIDGNFRACTALLTDPLGNGWCTFHLLFHQLELRTLQLFRRCQEIAGVSPQGSRCQRHHCRTCRAVKAGNKLAPLPMIRHILPLMRVGTRENESRQMLTLHHFPQVFQSLINIHNLSNFVISTLQRYDVFVRLSTD